MVAPLKNHSVRYTDSLDELHLQNSDLANLLMKTADKVDLPNWDESVFL